MTPGIFNMLSTIIENMLMKLKLKQYESIRCVVMEVSPSCCKIQVEKQQAHFQGIRPFQTYINRVKRAEKGQEEGLTFTC